jgi:DNA repair exonuclease SbcCD ATPase subunit
MINKSILLNVILVFVIIFGYFYFENTKNNPSANFSTISTTSDVSKVGSDLTQLESLNNQVIDLKQKLDAANKELASLKNQDTVLASTREEIKKSIKELDQVKSEISKVKKTSDLIAQIESEKNQIIQAQNKVKELTKYFEDRSKTEIQLLLKEAEIAYQDIVGSSVMTPAVPVIGLPILALSNQNLERFAQISLECYLEEEKLLGKRVSLNTQESNKYNEICIKGIKGKLQENLKLTR